MHAWMAFGQEIVHIMVAFRDCKNMGRKPLKSKLTMDECSYCTNISAVVADVWEVRKFARMLLPYLDGRRGMRRWRKDEDKSFGMEMRWRRGDEATRTRTRMIYTSEHLWR